MTKRFGLLRGFALAVALVGSAAVSSAYYHFVHYASKDGAYVWVREKFDLRALVNKTVYFYFTDQGPTKLADGDSFTSVITQLQLAGKTWDSVGSSDLRVAFGGFLPQPGGQSSRPHIEIVFEEMAPGVLGEGAPVVRADAVQSGTETLVPIVRSVMLLNKDLTQLPSYASSFFLTATHEMGHALGLQHSLASSMMSTSITRATTRAHPLTADDVAGLSLLYPTASFAATFGTLSGRVTMSGNGVHLASVVALTTFGHAVSALTNPDGTYSIQGLPPADYNVYVHPLPPSGVEGLGPAEIVLPKDAAGNPVAAGDPFKTIFYPGTADWKQANFVRVAAGAETKGIDFAVEGRGPLAVHSIQTWSYPGDTSVHPAFVNIGNADRNYLLAMGEGVLAGDGLTPGLSVSLMGSSALVKGVRPWAPYGVLVDFSFNPLSGEGPRHLIFSAGDDIYVLPAGLNLTSRQPPSIDKMDRGNADDGSPLVKIAGSNIDASTSIFFDGIHAVTTGFDAEAGELKVTPPAGAPGYSAHVVAVNPDGQVSGFVQFPPPVYKYDDGNAPSVSPAQASVTAGTEAMIEVAGVNTNFTAGQVTVAFGSSDVVVKRVWVVAPNRLRVNVAAGGAAAGDVGLVVLSGVQAINGTTPLHVAAAAAHQISLDSNVLNLDTRRSAIYPASNVFIPVANVAALPADAMLTMNGTAANINSKSDAGISFQVPAGIALGYAVLRLSSGSNDIAPPVFVFVDPRPPAIQAVAVGDTPVTADHPVKAWDIVTIFVSALGDPAAPVDANRVRVSLGGVKQPILGSIVPAEGRSGQHMIQIVLAAETPVGNQVPLVVSVDGLASDPVPIAVIFPGMETADQP